MAGDWIKVRTSLDTDPNIMRLARICRASVALCRASVAQTIGACVIFWGWASIHTDDGVAHGVALDWLDEFVGLPGFSDAMQEIGWLKVNGQTITIPRFERYNESPAKARAREANTERQRRLRADRVAPLSRDMSRDCRANVAPREEKRREEKSTRPNTLPTSSATSSKAPSPKQAKLASPKPAAAPTLPAAASVPVPPPEAPTEPADTAGGLLAHLGTIPNKPERPRNEAWDLVCKAWSLNPQTKSEKSRVGKLARDYWIKTEGAKDRLRRIEVQKGKYKSHMKGMTLSPEALLKWWDDLRAKPQLDAWGDPLPSADEVEKMLNAIHTQPPPPQYDDSVEDVELAEGIE